jgi:hypothetical protein
VSDNLAVGHATVAEYLAFNEERLLSNPSDMYAIPRLFIHKSCQNIARAVENYAFKMAGKAGASVTDSVNQKFKDGADVVRYLCMWHGGKTFADMSDGDGGSRDYDRFCLGRIPRAYRDAYRQRRKGTGLV